MKRQAELQITKDNYEDVVDDSSESAAENTRTINTVSTANRPVKKPVSRLQKLQDSTDLSANKAGGIFASFSNTPYQPTSTAAATSNGDLDAPKPNPFANISFSAAPAASTSTGFSFGSANGPVAGNSAFGSSSTAPTFSFGGTSTPAEKKIPPATTTNTNTFGSNSTQQATPASFSFSAAPVFSFGTTLSPSTGSDKKIEDKKKDEPSSVQEKTTTSTPSFQFSAQPTATSDAATKPSFSFGSSNNQTKALEKKPEKSTKSTGLTFNPPIPAKEVETKKPDIQQEKPVKEKNVRKEKLAALNCQFAMALQNAGISAGKTGKFDSEANVTDLSNICQKYLDYAKSIETVANDSNDEEPKKTQAGSVKMNFSFGQTASSAATESVKPLSEPSKPVDSKPQFQFSFQNPTSAPAANSFTFGTSSNATDSNKVSSSFSFGGQESPSKTTGFSFGNQPSFGGFGGSALKPKSNEIAEDNNDGDGDDGVEEEHEEQSEEQKEKLKTGAGEESEDCLMEVVCKVYMYVDGAPKDFGTGILKLNKSKDGSMYRFLARQDNTGKETVNARLNAVTNITIEGKKKKDIIIVTPTISPDGNPTISRYAIRVKESSIAESFADKVNECLQTIKNSKK